MVSCAIAAVLLLASWPYLVAWRSEGDGVRFTALLDGHQDYNTYFVKMEVGQRGEVLYRSPYQAAPGERLPLHLFWVGLGWVARWLGVGLEAMFHGARIVLGAAFLFFSYRLLRACLGRVRPGLLCFLLLTVSSGVSGLLVHVRRFQGVRFPWFADVLVPEGNTFFSLMLNPAFLFSMTMMTVAARSLLVAVRSGGGAWLAGVAGLLLGVVHPMSLGALWVVLGAFIGVEALLGSVRARRAGVLALRFFGLSVPAVAYHAFLWWRSPAIKSWVAQNVCLSPSPVSFLAGYGILLPVAVVGLLACFHRPRAASRLVALWLVLGFALLYAPVTVQRRLCEGYHIPVVLAAGMALRSGRRMLLWPVIIVLSLGTTHLLVRSYLERAEGREYPSFIEDGLLRGMTWLRTERPGTLVLCAPASAWAATRYGGGRVVAGHWAETPAYGTRVEEVRSFLTGAMPPTGARRWLDRLGVQMLLWTPRETAFAGGTGPVAGDWDVAWKGRDVTLWERRESGTPGLKIED